MMRPRKLIYEGWNQYAEHVLPTNVSRVQCQETRRAFYAGAAHLWDSFIRSLGPGEEADPPELALADGVQREIDEWLDAIKSGRA